LKRIDPDQAKKAVVAARSAQAKPAAHAAAPPGGTASAPTSARAPRLFEKLGERLASAPELAKELAAVVRFEVTGPASTWTVDGANGASVRRGDAGKADAVITISDEDLAALSRGEETAQRLFQKGRMRVDGDVRVAHRLGFLKGLAVD
jgi:3-hydroxyacyl-CoA dehydrogenase/3a,7a,12a-trihydroxy-5b-cholest-24-enoyl-CoA hydratase